MSTSLALYVLEFIDTQISVKRDKKRKTRTWQVNESIVPLFFIFANYWFTSLTFASSVLLLGVEQF